MLNQFQPTHCARMLRALADPERLRIINVLRRGPHNVGQLAKLLNAEIVNVSHHLGVLRHAGIVHDVKQGRFVVYSLPPEIFRPGDEKATVDHLDLGCCRLEIPRATPS